MKSTHRLTLMALLIALGVAAATMSAIPLFGARLFPAQAAINVVAAGFLGPWYGSVSALITAVLRISLGLGSPLAIPGSFFGALLAGLLFRATRSRVAAAGGEVIGTGLIGALVSYPIAVSFMGNAKAAQVGMTFFIIPFGVSSLSGAILGAVALAALERFLPVSGRNAEA